MKTNPLFWSFLFHATQCVIPGVVKTNNIRILSKRIQFFSFSIILCQVRTLTSNFQFLCSSLSKYIKGQIGSRNVWDSQIENYPDVRIFSQLQLIETSFTKCHVDLKKTKQICLFLSHLWHEVLELDQMELWRADFFIYKIKLLTHS